MDFTHAGSRMWRKDSAHVITGNEKKKKEKENSPKSEVDDAETQEHVETPLSEGFVHDRYHFVQRPCTVTYSGHAFCFLFLFFLPPRFTLAAFPNPSRCTYTAYVPRREAEAPLKPSTVRNPLVRRGTGEMLKVPGRGGGAGEGDPWGGRDLRNETRERVGPERVNEFLWRKCLLVVLTFFFFHGRALISNSHLLRRAGKKREEEKTKQQNEKLATAAPCGFGFSSELLVLYSLETSWKLSPCH